MWQLPVVLLSLHSRHSLPCALPSLQCRRLSFLGARALSSSSTPYSSVPDNGVAAPASSDGILRTPIKKLLIANRGEIACRILRTAKLMGIRTVAVFSEADANSLHVKLADEAICIGPPPARQSYLNVPSLLAAARVTGAQAVHPGYGFLSENAEFAESCLRQKLLFVGPPAAAIRAMGDKIGSKKLMEAAGVPVVPGYHGDDQSEAHFVAACQDIGYPVMVKPSKGGGGKGMRIVRKGEELRDSLQSARREAEASFGDGALLVEKYIERPRHIEVQVFADKHGNYVHLFERDCSVQRRHQKVIEEAPAFNVSSAFRDHICQAAVEAARAVHYESAGTVEFIMDPVKGTFYFMEMNTRLQVEHPVTEMIVGQDLVEWQLRVAQGEPLPISQGDIRAHGHAMEARVYAEDTHNGFLPAAGKIFWMRRPVEREGLVRVDTGVEAGDEVTSFYDPMVAKVIVWGEDRDAAGRALNEALGRYTIAGFPSNVEFIRRILSNDEFKAGDVDTGFIERHSASLLPRESGQETPKLLQLAAVAASVVDKAQYLQANKESLSSPWAAGDGFRLHGDGAAPTKKICLHSSSPSPVTVQVATLRYGRYKASIDASSTGEKEMLEQSVSSAAVVRVSDVEFVGPSNAELEGESLATVVRFVATEEVSESEEGGRVAQRHTCLAVKYPGEGETNLLLLVGDGGEKIHVRIPDPESGGRAGGEGEKGMEGGGEVAVGAPMAGRVVRVMAVEGSRVSKNDALVVVEAMKMEHTVRAPMAGIVGGPLAREQQSVKHGQALLRILPLPAGDAVGVDRVQK